MPSDLIVFIIVDTLQNVNLPVLKSMSASIRLPFPSGETSHIRPVGPSGLWARCQRGSRAPMPAFQRTQNAGHTPTRSI
jgi:hypothetical protein